MPLFFQKGENFCDFLIAFLYFSPLLKKGSTLKGKKLLRSSTVKGKNLLPRGTNSFLFSERSKNNLDMSFPLESVSVPLNPFFHSLSLQLLEYIILSVHSFHRASVIYDPQHYENMLLGHEATEKAQSDCNPIRLVHCPFTELLDSLENMSRQQGPNI